MKRTQKSQKRTKFLFLLIVLTAILSITATYAWFSTQRDVEISNMHVRIESAENMQLSLDGENWTQTIDIKDMKQLYGTWTGSGDAIYQANKMENKNYIPTELLPVSADGTVVNGTLGFVKGTLNGKTLSSITKCSEDTIKMAKDSATGETDSEKLSATIRAKEAGNAAHPYLVFDIYLRNLSRLAEDNLQLSYGSHVWVNTAATGTATNDAQGVANTGLENAARVGFVPLKTAVDLTASGTTVRTTTGAAGTETAAIWEPNYKEHTQYVVNNNKRGIAATTETTGTETYPVQYTAGDATPAVTISDVNSESGAGLSQTTSVLRPTYSLSSTAISNSEGATVSNVVGTTQIVDLKDTAGNQLKIAGNKITKVRVYLWIEGQDPDCIDLASTGKELSATIRLEKAKNTTSTSLPSYE